MISVNEFATKVGLSTRPISLTDLVRKFGTKSLREAIALEARDAAPATVTLDTGPITSGLSIGGSARLVIARGGETTLTSHLHNSGALGIDYLLSVIPLTPQGQPLRFNAKGIQVGRSPPDPGMMIGYRRVSTIRSVTTGMKTSKSKIYWTLHANDTLTKDVGKALEEALQEALKQAGELQPKRS